MTSPGSDSSSNPPRGVHLPTETPAEPPVEATGMTSRITAGLSPADEPEVTPGKSSFLDAPAPTEVRPAPTGMTSRPGFAPVPPPAPRGVAPIPPTASSPGFAPVAPPYQQPGPFSSQSGMAPVPQPYGGAYPQPGRPIGHTGPQPGLPINQTGPQPGLPINQTGPQPGLPIGAQPGLPVAQQQYAPPGYQPVAPARRPVPTMALIAVVALLVSAALALAGSFFTQFTFSSHVTAPNATASTSTITAWGVQYQPPGNLGASVTQFLGVPLALGAALAVIAAVLLIVSLSKPLAWVRVAAAISSAVLFGAGLTVVMWVLTQLGFAYTTSGYVETVSLGLGFWLVLGGTVVAAAATVLIVPVDTTHPR